MSTTLETLVALCKRRGFVYPTASIYDGINGVYDFGPLGTLLKKNIRKEWYKSLKNSLGQILPVEGSLLGPQKVWEASGHLANFSDPMVDCLECKNRFRADEIELTKCCPNCGKKKWTDIRQFNMMFETKLGAMTDASSSAFLRPETAQSIFINFKNIISSNRLKIPFGISQTGKAFRNEITPKQFLFRMREFEQMELEWFCKNDSSKKDFDFWIEKRINFYKSIGINENKIRLRKHESDELAHYSTYCTDIEYNFPFGWKELEGIAHRGNFDLSQHSKHSGKDLSVFDEIKKESFIPDVVECSVGTDRLFLTILFDAYNEDELSGEKRIVLKLNPKLSPIKAAILPLTNKQTSQAQRLFEDVISKVEEEVSFDASGSIGKRYRRQDEIGTPLCITYDFDSDKDQCVTVRSRDCASQERISFDNIKIFIQKLL